jgi:hypothetical protein
VFINVYLPSVGTADHELLYGDLLVELSAWVNKLPDCGYIVADDFNIDLNDQRNDLSTIVRHFLTDYNLCRCDESFSCDVQHTFVNESLNCYRKLDYIVYNSVDVVSYNVIDSASNLSDHLPLIAVCNCSFVGVRQRSDRCDIVEHLRWDQADLDGYYNVTGLYLHSLWLDLKNFECIDATINDAFFVIDDIYQKLIGMLQGCASKFVPKCRSNFYKFWWSQELQCLKEKAVDSDRIWKIAGRPRSGEIFNKRYADKRAYRAAHRKAQLDSVHAYSNDLHEALLKKEVMIFGNVGGPSFIEIALNIIR